MLVAQIKTDKRIYSLYSDNIENENIEIYGHYFENNKFYPLNNEVFNEFNKLKLGKNYKKIDTIIENNINYDVILDLDTNLKHYFNNGKENAQMFFHNFKPLVVALSNNQKENLKYMAGLLLIVLNFEIFAFNAVHIKSITINQPSSYNRTIEQLNETPELTVDIIKNIINSNPNLEGYDRNIILNDELLNWAMPYINMNKEYRAELYHYILPNFKIKKENIEGNTLGLRYYDKLVIDINKINNSDINSKDFYIDILTHEFAHILMSFNKYPFIDEGLTEIVTNEFAHYDKDPSNGYIRNQKYIKILMEIIGTEPIVKYCFTGDIGYIKHELISYLPEEKINNLIECFKMVDDDENFNKVESILKEAFYNKYGIQMENSYLIKYYLTNINYFNNPTEKIQIHITETICTTKEYIDENNVKHEIEVAHDIDEYINDMPKEILLISQSLEEAKEKLSNQKTK